MGVNATTFVPAYVAGEVLTAADLTVTNSGVPVFADAAARDAAFGGTGEKVLAEGQLAYLEDSDVVQYYDGSVWATLAPQPAPTSGLNFITGAAFTTVTSFSLPNSTFTATYENYKVIVAVTAVTADSDFTLRMRAAGTDDSSSTYRNMFLGINDGGAASNATGSGDSSFKVGESDPLARYNLVIDVLNPFSSALTTISGNYSFLNKAASNNIGRVGSGILTQTTSFDSLSFISSVASSITGYYKVYGYANS